MRRRLRRPTSPAGPPPTVEAGDYADLCWLRCPVDASDLRPARLVINENQLLLDCSPLPAWVVAEQPLSRLAQVEVRGADVQLLFVDASNTLTMTHLRDTSADKADAWVDHLLRHYQATTGEAFPAAWLCRLAPDV